MWSYRVCVCFTRKFRVTEAEPPPDVVGSFKKFTDGGAYMTAEQLRRFLAEEQGDTGATVHDAERIMDHVLQRRHHHIGRFIFKNSLSVEDFHYFLFCADLNPPIQSQVIHDMNAPLSHYYIYTGHNSYLTGNQLNSNCSDVPIINALNNGVRVIELDLWPDSNSSKDNVHVKHGGTLTSPVDLLKCLRSIKEHAFTASPYPVVITLEDHLTPRLQAIVAQMLTQTFGDVLFCPESDCLEELPSPEELKYRVIISTKPPKEYLEAKTFSKRKSTMRRKGSDDDEWGEEPSNRTDYQAPDDKYDGDYYDQNQDTEDYDEDDQKTSTSPEYKRLIAIHAGKPKEGLKKALKIEPDKVRRLSLSEQALEKAAKSHGTDLVRFTQKNILRIYPKGTRFNSSNYKPQVGWTHGAQMIAFNMQGYGRSLWLMQGMFRANGGCGYVKKPDFLLTTDADNEVFDPKVKLPIKKTIKVKVYMGDGWHLDFKKTHFDTYSPPDFYTRVGIAGLPADEMMKKTKIKEDMWTPVWNEEFTFPLTAPELALLRVEVHEYDISGKDDFAGQTCLPVPEIRPGIRAVSLCDRKGVNFPSVKLLMRFEFE